jgi:hypothetical protein
MLSRERFNHPPLWIGLQDNIVKNASEGCRTNARPKPPNSYDIFYCSRSMQHHPVNASMRIKTTQARNSRSVEPVVPHTTSSGRQHQYSAADATCQRCCRCECAFNPVHGRRKHWYISPDDSEPCTHGAWCMRISTNTVKYGRSSALTQNAKRIDSFDATPTIIPCCKALAWSSVHRLVQTSNGSIAGICRLSLHTELLVK